MKRILGFILLTLVFIAGCTKTPEIITIGFMGPLSGDAASYGLSIQKGVELAKKDMALPNVAVVYEDSKCEGKEAATAIHKLIALHNVQAIIGEVCSGATLAAAPIANENSVVLISSASTSPDLTPAGDYILRVIPSDSLQGAFGAKLVYDRGQRALAVLYSNEEYGSGFNKVLTAEFTKSGGKVVASEAVDRGTADVRSALTKIKNKKPDALYIIANSPETAAAALKQAKELGLTAHLYGSEGLKSDDIIKAAEGAAEGLTVTSVSAGSPAFIESYQAWYNTMPGPFAAQGYDAYKALALAIQQGANTGKEIKEKLSGLSFDGASGHIVFDQNGDVFGNYEVYVVKDVEFVRD